MAADDFSLMEAVRADREGAFEQFVERYQKRLYRLAWGYLRQHEDALDAVQEAMVKVYLARHRYRPESHPYTWVSRILANHCLDMLRRRRARPEGSLEGWQEVNPGQEVVDERNRDGPHDEHARREFRRRVEEAVSGLPETQREVFTLRHFEELSLEEIASARGCALGTVKSSLHRAAESIRESLRRSERMIEEPGR